MVGLGPQWSQVAGKDGSWLPHWGAWLRPAEKLLLVLLCSCGSRRGRGLDHQHGELVTAWVHILCLALDEQWWSPLSLGQAGLGLPFPTPALAFGQVWPLHPRHSAASVPQCHLPQPTGSSGLCAQTGAHRLSGNKSSLAEGWAWCL